MQLSSAMQLVTSSFASNRIKEFEGMCLIYLHLEAFRHEFEGICLNIKEWLFTQFSFYFLDIIFGCSFNYPLYWWLGGRWVQYQYVRVNNFCLREILIIVPLSWAGENDMAVVMGLECVLVKAWNAGILKIAVYEEQLLAQLLIMTEGKGQKNWVFSHKLVGCYIVLRDPNQLSEQKLFASHGDEKSRDKIWRHCACLARLLLVVIQQSL